MPKPLTDLDPMPYGKYAGKPMQDVPANYCHYLWCAGKKQEPQGADAVADYIRANLRALKMEYPDGEW
jgi:uncharacterized protein (DUF3820 family)